MQPATRTCHWVAGDARRARRPGSRLAIRSAVPWERSRGHGRSSGLLSARPVRSDPSVCRGARRSRRCRGVDPACPGCGLRRDGPLAVDAFDAECFESVEDGQLHVLLRASYRSCMYGDAASRRRLLGPRRRRARGVHVLSLDGTDRPPRERPRFAVATCGGVLRLAVAPTACGRCVPRALRSDWTDGLPFRGRLQRARDARSVSGHR